MYLFFCVIFYDFLKTSEKELKKHLFFLFKVYYSPMDGGLLHREREKKNEELKLIIIIIIII